MVLKENEIILIQNEPVINHKKWLRRW